LSQAPKKEQPKLRLREKEKTKGQQENAKLRERIAKLEGMMESQKKPSVPRITPEEKKEMEGRFRQDFQTSGIDTLHNFIWPYMEDARIAKEEVLRLRQEFQEKEEMKQRAVGLVEKARQEDPEGFDVLKPAIEKELRENKNKKEK